MQVFFVLRKKTNQVSYLHLYHHSMMPVCGWIGAKFLPGYLQCMWHNFQKNSKFCCFSGGHGTLLGVINSFIHVIMYSYYLVSSLGPEYQKFLWWKRYLTTMQMVSYVKDSQKRNNGLQYCDLFIVNQELNSLYRRQCCCFLLLM